MHEGRQYQVEKLDFDDRKAYVRRVDVDYYTDANLDVNLRVLDVFDETGDATKVSWGEVLITSLVSIFKKMKMDTGENVGFDVELAQAVCAYYGWEYVPVPFNWDAKDAELSAGSCDCIWSGFTINGREDDYLWSKPYSDNTQMILVLGGSGIARLADLAGKKVGVQTATSAYTLLTDEEGQKELADTFASLEVYENYTVAITDLKAGAVDALAIDVTRANEAIANDSSLALLDEALGSEQYGIGFRKNDTELCDLVNAALDALAVDGTVDAIAQGYPEIAEYLTLGK